MGVHFIELGVKPSKCGVEDSADTSRRMIRRNKFFEPFETEQSFLHYVWTTHVFCLLF